MNRNQPVDKFDKILSTLRAVRRDLAGSIAEAQTLLSDASPQSAQAPTPAAEADRLQLQDASTGEKQPHPDLEELFRETRALSQEISAQFEEFAAQQKACLVKTRAAAQEKILEVASSIERIDRAIAILERDGTIGIEEAQHILSAPCTAALLGDVGQLLH